jgi:hypothetical protein
MFASFGFYFSFGKSRICKLHEVGFALHHSYMGRVGNFASDPSVVLQSSVGQTFWPDERRLQMRRTFRCCRRICQAGKPNLRPTRSVAVLPRGPAKFAVQTFAMRLAWKEDGCGSLGFAFTSLRFRGRERSELLFTAKLSKNEPTSSVTDVKSLPFGNTHPPRPSRVALMCRVVSPTHGLAGIRAYVITIVKSQIAKTVDNLTRSVHKRQL